MFVTYSIGNMIGYFFIMIILMVIAILLAKKGAAAWVVYGIGAILQLISLIGKQSSASAFGIDITGYWGVYIIILVVSALIIVKRYNNRLY